MLAAFSSDHMSQISECVDRISQDIARQVVSLRVKGGHGQR